MRFRLHNVAGLNRFQRDPLGPMFVRRKSSAPTPPPPPAPSVVANAQTGSNIDTQIGNMVGTSGPSGSTSYNQSGSYTDPNTGQVIPQWTQNTSLTPLGQSIFNGTQSAANTLTGTAGKLADAASTSATTPLNFSGANQNIIQQGPQATDDNVASAVYNEQAGFLQPTYQQQQKDLQDQLSRQGISVGNDAYSNAQTQLANTQNQGYTAAANNATAQGSQAGANMFNMALLGQNQQIGQQQIAQSNPLSLLSQIYGGAGSPTGVA